jgi:hypothetical protein
LKEIPQGQIAYAEKFVQAMEEEITPLIRQVEDGPFVRGVLQGSFPLDGVRFVHTNHYHLIINDMGNLNLYVAKARNEDEMLFFHFMAAEEKNHLQTLFLLTDALGIERGKLRATEPNARCLLRTNYFSRLALYATPGEIALGILLNFPVWAAGARQEALGLRRNYGLGHEVPGTGKRDTDILDRFAAATKGFKDTATKIIARDLSNDTEEKMKLVGRWSVEYETLVWESYYR